jgi:hypothetical protein
MSAPPRGTEAIDADDLAMLADGFGSALAGTADAGDATDRLVELGWIDVLAASPWQAVATAFTALGASASAAAIIDDVLTHALGLEPSPGTCVVLPAPHGAEPSGRRVGDRLVVDGIASARIDRATSVLVAVTDGGGRTAIASVEPSAIAVAEPGGLDPACAYRRVRTEIDARDVTTLDAAGTWADAVALARTALAHELIASARTMLDHARSHAVDRVQFGHPVAGFQAVRHKLAESLVHIEAAAAATDVCGPGADPLVPALAKSLAGKAARASASNAQQVLAGIGFTTEHPFHRWLKRSLVVDMLFGSASSLPVEIGRELLSRGGAPRLVEL